MPKKYYYLLKRNQKHYVDTNKKKKDNDVIARYGTYIYSDLNAIIFTNNFL